MTSKELNKILENHRHWINRDCEDWKNMKANLSNVNLRNAELSGVDLCYVDLRNADLSNADLSGA